MSLYVNENLRNFIMISGVKIHLRHVTIKAAPDSLLYQCRLSQNSTNQIISPTEWLTMSWETSGRKSNIILSDLMKWNSYKRVPTKSYINVSLFCDCGCFQGGPKPHVRKTSAKASQGRLWANSAGLAQDEPLRTQKATSESAIPHPKSYRVLSRDIPRV